MSVIRPLKPRQEHHVCPDCGAPEGLVNDANNHVMCKLCGWHSNTPIGSVSVMVCALSRYDPHMGIGGI